MFYPENSWFYRITCFAGLSSPIPKRCPQQYAKPGWDRRPKVIPKRCPRIVWPQKPPAGAVTFLEAPGVL